MMLKETALIGGDGILLAITCYTFIGSTEVNQMIKKGHSFKKFPNNLGPNSVRKLSG